MGYTPYIDFFVKADKKGIIKGKKIFLQHGIIKDNLTYLYNNNVNLDLFVCSAKPEYEYVKNLYGYKDSVVQMLGLCRYDALYKNEQPTKKFCLCRLGDTIFKGLTKRICKKRILQGVFKFSCK